MTYTFNKSVLDLGDYCTTIDLLKTYLSKLNSCFGIARVKNHKGWCVVNKEFKNYYRDYPDKFDHSYIYKDGMTKMEALVYCFSMCEIMIPCRYKNEERIYLLYHKDSLIKKERPRYEIHSL